MLLRGAVMASATVAPHGASSDDERGEHIRLLGSHGAAASEGDDEGSAPGGGGGGPVSCDELLEHVGVGRWNMVVVLVCGLGNAADAVELMCVGFIIPVMPDFDESHGITPADVAWRKGFLAAAVFLGMLVGGLLCGLAADRVGRRPCLLVSLGVTSTFGLASAAMAGWKGVAACRVLAGFGVGGAVPAVFSLGIEVVPPASRGQAQNWVALNWTLGTIFTALLAYFTLDQADGGAALQSGLAPWRVR